MQRHPVLSRSLKSVGYDASMLLLEIEFRGGGVYQYVGVPQLIHDQLLSALSKGRFFNSHIKARFVCRQIS